MRDPQNEKRDYLHLPPPFTHSEVEAVRIVVVSTRNIAKNRVSAQIEFALHGNLVPDSLRSSAAVAVSQATHFLSAATLTAIAAVLYNDNFSHLIIWEKPIGSGSSRIDAIKLPRWRGCDGKVKATEIIPQRRPVPTPIPLKYPNLTASERADLRTTSYTFTKRFTEPLYLNNKIGPLRSRTVRGNAAPPRNFKKNLKIRGKSKTLEGGWVPTWGEATPNWGRRRHPKLG